MNAMTVRKWMAVFMISVLPLGFAGVTVSAQEVDGIGADGVTVLATLDQEEQSAQEARGKITKIEGTVITVLSDSGEELTVHVEDTEALENLKVGDRVVMKEGRLTKEEE
ncbi:hypothetical protein [Desulfoglaeba alkanexedens]|jgi:cell division protein FtsX|uniref:DUF5666 domain-containing protein n=1 Tax=Desulfoglaeba alkanexedens ALDC TaxID=980445 RepID=A0A4P8L7D0_9BACT|nr:hypothetical protein [Desulfoglaeba alkanexedens]QCQ22562.1 hypothetical protein FDQ92_10540 [Desulfoglaeba alkanexedens ALDC]